jgi:hypothetical protein
MKNSLLLIILSSLPLFSCSSSGSGHSDIILPSNPDTSIIGGSLQYILLIRLSSMMLIVVLIIYMVQVLMKVLLLINRRI